MKTYNCKCRQKGSVQDETRKRNVTGAEIRVLRDIHGEDAVLDITEVGQVDRTQDGERDRLSAVYGEKVVNKLFGAKTQPMGDLPTQAAAPAAQEIPVLNPEPPLPEVKRESAPADNALFT